jgi:hypothetical protein
MSTRNALLALNALLVAALACNMPAGGPAVPVQAAGPEVAAQPPVEIPVTGPIETLLPSPTPTITLTPTSSVPMVSVSVNTNCRTGPGVVYDLVGALLIGEQTVVIGKYTPGNYWIINNPDGVGICWLWGEYATVTGDTSGLPEYPPPPTPTPYPPAPPKAFEIVKHCIPMQAGQYNLIVLLKWEDQADNEDGYRIYFNGAPLTTVGSDATQFGYALVVPMGMQLTYGVEAYNGAGASARKSKSIHCP